MFALNVLYWSICRNLLVNDPELSLFEITYSKNIHLLYSHLI